MINLKQTIIGVREQTDSILYSAISYNTMMEVHHGAEVRVEESVLWDMDDDAQSRCIEELFSG